MTTSLVIIPTRGGRRPGPHVQVELHIAALGGGHAPGFSTHQPLPWEAVALPVSLLVDRGIKNKLVKPQDEINYNIFYDFVQGNADIPFHSKGDLIQYTFEMAMTCEGCANAARRVLGKLGEEKVTVDKIDVATKQVVVTSDLPANQILETLQKTGKEVKLLQ